MTNKPPRPPSLSSYRPSEDRHGVVHPQSSHIQADPRLHAPQHRPSVDPGAPQPYRRTMGAPGPRRSHFGFGSLLLYGLVALLAVFAAGLTFLIVSPPTDLIRSQVIQAVKKNTGRDLAIKGSTSISFYPSIGISMGDVRLGAPPDMGGPAMVKMDNLTVAVKLLPLLSREVVVDTLVLTRPVFDLRIDRNGRKSWDFAQARRTPAPRKHVRLANARFAQNTANDAIPPEAREFLENATDNQNNKPAKEIDIAALEQLRLGDVRIVDGAIRYTDVPQNATQNVDAINVSLDLTSISAPLQAKGGLVWNGEKINFDSTLTSIKSLMRERPAKLNTKVTSRTFTAVYDGTIATKDELTLDGALNADTKSMRALAGWLGTKLPNVSGYGPLSIQGRLKSRGNRHSILNAKIGIDGATATGNATLTTGSVRPHIKAKLKMSVLDLNKYISNDEQSSLEENASPDDTGSSPALNGPQVRGYQKRAGWSREPIDLTSLGAVDADADMTVGRLLYKKIKVDSTRLGVTLKDHKLRADLSEMRLYKGTGRGIVTLSAKTSKSASLGVSFAVNNIAARPLLTDAADIGWLSGTGNLTLAISSQGANQSQIIEALNGNASFDFNNGAIVGFNLPQAIRSISQGQLKGLSSSPTQQTDFSEFSATFNIKNGVASNSDLALASPLLRVTGKGDIFLPPQTVDYTIKPKLVAELEGQGGARGVSGIVIPVRIHGPFDNLAYTPDIGSILKNPDQAVDTIKQIGEKLKSLKGKKPQEILDSILGGGQNQPAGDQGGNGQTSQGGKKFDAKKLLDGLFGN